MAVSQEAIDDIGVLRDEAVRLLTVFIRKQEQHNNDPNPVARTMSRLATESAKALVRDLGTAFAELERHRDEASAAKVRADMLSAITSVNQLLAMHTQADVFDAKMRAASGKLPLN